jgi:hypothetical protein
MIREELQHDFHNEQGISWINSQGEPDIDYVMWLEDKILATKNLSLPPAEGADCFYYDKPGKEKITPAQQQPTAEGGNLNLDDINYSDLPIPKPSLYPAEGAKTCWGCGEELHYLPNGLPPYRCECGAVNPAETMETQPQPTAEGAEHKPKKKLSAHSFWSWYSKDYKTFMVSSTNEIHFDIEDLWRFMDAFATQPQPTAEGAEEYLKAHLSDGENMVISDRLRRRTKEIMNGFATLHAQKIADKMVSEKLREELIKYEIHWNFVLRDNAEKVVDEYLKSRESHDNIR